MTRQKIRDAASISLAAVAIALILYLGVATTAWQWRNPKANQMTFWKEMPAPLRFEKLEKYQ